MFLYDYHVHSDVSLDSDASMYEMVCAEARAGMQQMCFTNHFDMVDWDEFKPVHEMPTAASESVRKFELMKQEHSLPLDVRLGVELGEANHNPSLAMEAAKSPGLDFVLGALHVLPGYGDVYYIKYTSREQCRKIYDFYMDCLLEIADMNFFDVMAHIGFCRRYMAPAGFDERLSLALYGEKVEALLKKIIGNGRGIEINTSGLRDGLDAYPDEEILRLYKELGGEILTIGSDAHKPEDAAKCIRGGFELAEKCGFRYVAEFRQRKPSFIKIQ